MKTKKKHHPRETPLAIVDLIQWAYWKQDMSGPQIAEHIGYSAGTVYKYIHFPNRWQRRTKWAIKLATLKGAPTPSFNKVEQYKHSA